jgi:hypothetical protein
MVSVPKSSTVVFTLGGFVLLPGRSITPIEKLAHPHEDCEAAGMGTAETVTSFPGDTHLILV